MKEITTKAVLAGSGKYTLWQECFDDFEEAYAMMRQQYNKTLESNGLYKGHISRDSAMISVGDVIIAQWAISIISCEIPENTCLAATISTAHIDIDTEREWNAGRLPSGVYPKADYGWIIYVPGPNEQFEMHPPKCVSDIFKWAEERNIDIVILDSDADMAVDLPQYDWVD